MQIDVRKPAARNFLLVILEHRRVGAALSVENDVEDRMQAGVAGERAPKLALVHAERMRRLAAPVEHARHQALAAQSPRIGGAATLALLDLELDSFTGHFGGEV